MHESLLSLHVACRLCTNIMLYKTLKSPKCSYAWWNRGQKDLEASITLIHEVEKFIFAAGPTAYNFLPLSCHTFITKLQIILFKITFSCLIAMQRPGKGTWSSPCSNYCPLSANITVPHQETQTEALPSFADFITQRYKSITKPSLMNDLFTAWSTSAFKFTSS